MSKGKLIKLFRCETGMVSENKIQKLFKNPAWEELLPVHATRFDWFCILGCLQLALRHPENNGPSATIVRDLAKLLAERLIEDIEELDKEFTKKANWEEFGIGE